MEIIMWVLTGAALGWAGFVYLGFNEQRGIVVSIIIGAVGGLAGGKLVAPMFTTPAVTPGDPSVATVLFAAIVAAAALAVGNLIHKRWGV